MTKILLAGAVNGSNQVQPAYLSVTDNGDGTVSLNVNTDGVAPTVTQSVVAVGASASGTIPSGAKGWSIAFLTGTGTFGGVAVPAGFSDSDDKTLAAAIAYTTNSSSSAVVRYGT